jgi:predicted tellurium resistance membrane protein TerC
MKKKVLNFLKHMASPIPKYFDDVLLFIGIALISVGVFKIYIPAGYIILGICIIAFAFIYARSKEGDHG